MYCSSCGVAVTAALTYCNYCGERLSGAKRDSIIKSPEVRPETLIGAMVFTFVFGLGAITVLMGVMKAVLHFDYGPIVAFTLLSFLIMLSLEGVIVRLLFRRQHRAEEEGDTAPLNGQATRELDAAQARVLPEPIPSVTEHTTRAFDPSYPERTSK
jgi:hypothetical protein